MLLKHVNDDKYFEWFDNNKTYEVHAVSRPCSYIHVWKVKKALSVNNATKIPIVIMLHIVVCVRINCRNTLNLV